MVGEVGEGGEGVGKDEIFNRFMEVVKWVGKDEVGVWFAIHEKAG